VLQKVFQSKNEIVDEHVICMGKEWLIFSKILFIFTFHCLTGFLPAQLLTYRISYQQTVN